MTCIIHIMLCANNKEQIYIFYIKCAKHISIFEVLIVLIDLGSCCLNTRLTDIYGHTYLHISYFLCSIVQNPDK
jgi:hypothetical protein